MTQEDYEKLMKEELLNKLMCNIAEVTLVLVVVTILYVLYKGVL